MFVAERQRIALQALDAFEGLRQYNEVRTGNLPEQPMIQTVEAIIDEAGQVKLTQPLGIKGLHRALVTILEEPPAEALETVFLSEQSLGACRTQDQSTAPVG